MYWVADVKRGGVSVEMPPRLRFAVGVYEGPAPSGDEGFFTTAPTEFFSNTTNRSSGRRCTPERVTEVPGCITTSARNTSPLDESLVERNVCVSPVAGP